MYAKVTNVAEATAVLIAAQTFQITDGWVLFISGQLIILALPPTGFYWTELTETEYNELSATIEEPEQVRKYVYSEEDDNDEFSIR